SRPPKEKNAGEKNRNNWREKWREKNKEHQIYSFLYFSLSIFLSSCSYFSPLRFSLWAVSMAVRLQARKRAHTFFASSRLLAVISASSRNSNRRSFINTFPAQMVVVTMEFSNPNRMCQGRLSTVIGVVG